MARCTAGVALADLPLMATKCEESTETIVPLVSHDCGTRVGQPALLAVRAEVMDLHRRGVRV